MPMSVEAAAEVMREAMRDKVKRHSLWYLIQGGVMVLAGIPPRHVAQDRPKGLSEISLDARDASQDTLNTAVSSDFIYAAQPFIGTLMHARGLFRKWLQKVWFSPKAH
jgi:hypothetical protein